MQSKFNGYFYVHTFTSGIGPVYFDAMQTEMVDVV